MPGEESVILIHYYSLDSLFVPGPEANYIRPCADPRDSTVSVSGVRTRPRNLWQEAPVNATGSESEWRGTASMRLSRPIALHTLYRLKIGWDEAGRSNQSGIQLCRVQPTNTHYETSTEPVKDQSYRNIPRRFTAVRKMCKNVNLSVSYGISQPRQASMLSGFRSLSSRRKDRYPDPFQISCKSVSNRFPSTVLCCRSLQHATTSPLDAITIEVHGYGQRLYLDRTERFRSRSPST